MPWVSSDRSPWRWGRLPRKISVPSTPDSAPGTPGSLTVVAISDEALRMLGGVVLTGHRGPRTPAGQEYIRCQSRFQDAAGGQVVRTRGASGPFDRLMKRHLKWHRIRYMRYRSWRPWRHQLSPLH